MLLSGQPDAVYRVASQYHIRYVFVDKRNGDNVTAIEQTGFSNVFENSTVLILGADVLLPQPPPSWWPTGKDAMEELTGLVPPPPGDGVDELQASYYRAWYTECVEGHALVLGLSRQDARGFAGSVDISADMMWNEVRDLRVAEELGIIGDSRYPGYHFSLWQAFGRPSSWPAVSVDRQTAAVITPPRPPSGVVTEAVKEWYKLNRARLATVYYGVEDQDPEIHNEWASQYDDLSLYTEITDLRRAYDDGVVGSEGDPFGAYRAWKRSGGTIH